MDLAALQDIKPATSIIMQAVQLLAPQLDDQAVAMSMSATSGVTECFIGTSLAVPLTDRLSLGSVPFTAQVPP
jgi:hypothetical protein